MPQTPGKYLGFGYDSWYNPEQGMGCKVPHLKVALGSRMTLSYNSSSAYSLFQKDNNSLFGSTSHPLLYSHTGLATLASAMSRWS